MISVESNTAFRPIQIETLHQTALEMSFWSWGEPTQQDETQTASFWRWGEPAATVAPTQPYPVAAAATAQDETQTAAPARSPTFWWSEPEAPQPEPDARSTATYAAGEDAGALAARAKELGLQERAARRKSAPSRRDVDLALARQQPDVSNEPEAPEDASPPKWSEPIARPSGRPRTVSATRGSSASASKGGSRRSATR